MALSLNTNRGAMAALQTLNSTNKGLDQVQKRVSTGLSVASTKDDSATFITAQNLRGRQGDLKAVTNSLGNAKSVVDVAVSGAEQISDAVNQMKTLAKQAADATITSDQRTALDTDFKALVKQVDTVVKASEFNGANLLITTAPTGTVNTVNALQSLVNTNSSGGYTADTLEVTSAGLSVGTSGASPLSTATTIAGADNSAATTAITTLETYGGLVKTALSKLGSASRNIDAQLSFSSKLGDTLTSGIGNLVDADMAKESARLQSLQTKQQLGMTALSMANQGPSAVAQLFRG